MKTYEEMARCALEARDEHEKKRKRKIYIAQRAVSAVAGVFAAFFIGFGIWNNYKKPDTYYISDNTAENTTTSSASAALPSSEEATMTTLTTIAATADKTTTQTGAQTTVSSSAASVQTQQTASTNKVTETAAAKHTTTSTVPRTSAATTATANNTTVTTTVDDVPGSVPYTGGSGGVSHGEGGGDMSVGGGSGPSPEGSDLWYSLPDYLAYEDASIDGYTEIYHFGYQISSDNIGSNIGTAVMKSSYPVDGVIKTCNAYAYHINGFSDENIIAIRFDGKSEYYLYLTEETNYFYIKMQVPSLE